MLDETDSLLSSTGVFGESILSGGRKTTGWGKSTSELG
jgi:hypothetical protein